jgi:hypothetical protein
MLCMYATLVVGAEQEGALGTIYKDPTSTACIWSPATTAPPPYLREHRLAEKGGRYSSLHGTDCKKKGYLRSCHLEETSDVGDVLGHGDYVDYNTIMFLLASR